MWAAIELAVIVVVLFLSGFVAWGKERDKNADLYRGLNERQRKAIANQLRPFSAMPTIKLTVINTPDCATFAVDLKDAIERAIPQPITAANQVVIDPQHNPIPTGIVIIARPNDERAPTLRRALRTVAKVSATLRTDDQAMFFEVRIGVRLS